MEPDPDLNDSMLTTSFPYGIGRGKKKLMFLHHVATLDKDSIAHKIYCTQKKLMLPGLVEDCSDMLAKWQICDVTEYSPGQWNKYDPRTGLPGVRNCLFQKTLENRPPLELKNNASSSSEIFDFE